jgi:alpha/beta superfamily hydrolase
MVQRGQYLERSVVVHSGGVALDGLYHRGTRAPPCAIASPHPAFGGSMTVPVVAELAWALTRAGFATMRFDWRGVGGSQGRRRAAAASIGDVAEEAGDLLAAIDQLLATTRARSACAVGYSFGAAVALAAARDARVGRVVLVAPPTALADFGAVARLGKPALAVCGSEDRLCDAAALPGIEVATIEGADHGFSSALRAVGRAVAKWLGGGAEMPVEAAEPDGAEVREVELDPGDDPPPELDD